MIETLTNVRIGSLPCSNKEQCKSGSIFNWIWKEVFGYTDKSGTMEVFSHTTRWVCKNA